MRAVALAFVLFVLILLFGTAHADAIARRGADWVQITALPCKDATVSALIQQAGGDPVDWRAASAQFSGVAFAACWRPDFGQGIVFLRFNDGDAGQVPFGALTPLKEA